MLASYKKSLPATFVVVFLLALGFQAYAQSGRNSGSIKGTVLDPTGAVVRMRPSKSTTQSAISTEPRLQSGNLPSLICRSIRITSPCWDTGLLLIHRTLMFGLLFP